MSRANPLVRRKLARRHESSYLRPVTDSDSTNKQWSRSANESDELSKLAATVLQLQRTVDTLRIYRSEETSQNLLYPFKLMYSPGMPQEKKDAYDTSEGVVTGRAWRTFRVRAGSYGTTTVEFTDGADENPVDPSVNPYPDFDDDSPIDFVVPDATIAYYVWIDVTDPDLPVIDSSVTRPGDGTDATWWGGSYILIAVIDTSTHSTEKRALVRQYLRSDVPKCSA